MAGEKLTQQQEKTSGFADDDLQHVVDVSNTSQSPQGSSFKVKLLNLWKFFVTKISGRDTSVDNTTGVLTINDYSSWQSEVGGAIFTVAIPDTASAKHNMLVWRSGGGSFDELTVTGYASPKDGATVTIRVANPVVTNMVLLGNAYSGAAPSPAGTYTFVFNGATWSPIAVQFESPGDFAKRIVPVGASDGDGVVWDNTLQRWVLGSSATSGWLLGGNSGIDPDVDKFGTTDGDGIIRFVLGGTDWGYWDLGADVVANGQAAAQGNTGTDVVANGSSAAQGNTGSDVVALGRDAALSNTKSNIFTISPYSIPTFANKAAADAEITAGNGYVPGLYIYWNIDTADVGGVLV